MIYLLMLLAPLQDALPEHPSEISAPALRSYSASAPERASLPGGAELLVIEDPSLPLVDGTLVFRFGSVLDPPDKVGLTSIAADCMREGGSESSPGAALDAWLDLRAATLELTPSEETLSFRFSCASEDLDELLDSLFSLVRAPLFPDAVLASSKQRAESVVARSEDDPSSFADALLLEVVYGSTSPWARRPTVENIRAIERSDLLAWHASNFGPDRLVAGVTGDVSKEALAERFSKLLEGWNPAPARELTPAPVFNVPASTTVHLYDRPGVPQSELRFAGPGILRLHPDYAPLLLWSDVVGIGGATNRMMVRLRTELGLAYTVGAYFRPGWEHSGRLIGFIGTRNEAARTALSSMFEVITESVDPIEAEELAEALERHRNAEVFRVDTPHEVLDRSMLLLLHGYPPDFWDKNWGRLAQLDAEQVAAASRRHIDTERMVVVAVGPAEVLEPQLAQFGEVIRLDRQPPAAAPAEWLDRLFTAVGPRELWAEAQGVEYVTEMTGLAVGGSSARSHSWISFLDASSRTETEGAGTKTTMVVGPARGWARTTETLTEFPAVITERARGRARTNLYKVLQVLAEAELEALSLDAEGRLNGALAAGERFVLELGEGGFPVSLAIQSGGEDLLTRYADWTSTSGVAFAKRATQVQEKPIERHLSGFVLHEELAEELFQEP
ncbi:MAG: insulinase family protein [Planctomycetes bacterium]|nr:insulinase family protein [Planctomycetota bacterium]